MWQKPIGPVEQVHPVVVLTGERDRSAVSFELAGRQERLLGMLFALPHGWHTQTMRAGRHLVAEDFAAVATDLAARGITTAEQLGASGGSAGGLLVGIMLTQYPQLFGILVCDAPVLDMRRYPLMGVGAASVAEFGDPDDPGDWEFMAKYSPYQNISAPTRYPPVLITAAINDDRVQPGHARKMTAALQAAGHRVLYYERIEGGHGGAANTAQAAFNMALTYEFLLRTLVDARRKPAAAAD